MILKYLQILCTFIHLRIVVDIKKYLKFNLKQHYHEQRKLDNISAS